MFVRKKRVRERRGERDKHLWKGLDEGFVEQKRRARRGLREACNEASDGEMSF